MRRKILWLTFWVTMAFWFGFGVAGCESPNESTRLGSAHPLPALGNAKSIEFATTPSVTGADRSHWESVTIRVSVDDARSWPTYGRYSLLNAEERGPRAQGVWPTLATSIQTSQGQEDVATLYAEVPYDAAHQFANMVLIPAYFVTRTWPGAQIIGPREAYQRSVMSTLSANEVLESDELGSSE